jgi:hypothetical protein
LLPLEDHTDDQKQTRSLGLAPCAARTEDCRSGQAGSVQTHRWLSRSEAGLQEDQGIDGGRTDIWILKRHVAVHGGLLCPPDSQLAPACHGHGLDQRDLGCGAGLEFVHIIHEQITLIHEKTVRRFFFEDYGLRQKAVAEAVAGGFLFALLGGGASRAGLCRCHKTIQPHINAD